MKFQDKFYDIIDHNKCPSSEKSDEKCILRKSNFQHFEPRYAQCTLHDYDDYEHMFNITRHVSLLTLTQCALVSTCWLLTSVPPHTSSTVPPPSAPTAATQGWLPRTLVCPATMRRAESRSRASPVHCLFGGSVEWSQIFSEGVWQG